VGDLLRFWLKSTQLTSSVWLKSARFWFERQQWSRHCTFLPISWFMTISVYSDIQWIGLRENLQESPMIFMGKSMVSC
jgi:hypothetical protein